MMLLAMVPVEFSTWMPFWALIGWSPPPVMVTPVTLRSARLNTVAFFWKSLIEPPVMVKPSSVSLSTCSATPRWTPLTTGSPVPVVVPGA